MEYATIDAFRRDPAKVWEFYSKRLDVLKAAEPNAAHLALAELERERQQRRDHPVELQRVEPQAAERGKARAHGFKVDPTRGSVISRSADPRAPKDQPAG
jgi:NAD-dependent deacetylase